MGIMDILGEERKSVRTKYEGLVDIMNALNITVKKLDKDIVELNKNVVKLTEELKKKK